jgi:uncharacterized delta-60 repeat protein
MMTVQASSPIRLTVIVVAALMAWLPGGAPSAHAAAGDLDPTFGTGGKVTTDIGASDDRGRSVAVQSDGKIVVAGTETVVLYNTDSALVRYNTDGSLDPTFGTGGKVTTAVGPSDDTYISLALQSDGKIVATGGMWNFSNSDMTLVRYNTDGSLDPAFGSGGKVITVFGAASSEAGYSVAAQSDGKILVAGYSTYNGGNRDFALVRYNTDGSLDPAFGTGGKVTTAVGPFDDEGYSMALQSDGKIVVAGYSYNGSNYAFALVRYNTDGSLDPTFGSGGKVITVFGTSEDLGYSVALQSDGKIVVAGYSYNGSNNDFALARYNTDGSLDPTFGTGGKVTTAVGPSDDQGHSVTVQSDGKIVVAGYSYNGSNNDFALVRYNTDGSLDPTFGTGGKVTTAVGPSDDEPYAMALQSDGNILVAGYSYNGSNNDFALVRYLGSTVPQPPTATPTATPTSTPTQTPTASNPCKRAIALQARMLAGKELTLFQMCLDRIATGKLACQATQCVINPSSASPATVAGSTCSISADCCPDYDNVRPTASTEARIETAAGKTKTAIRRACSLANGPDGKKGTDDDTYVDPQTLGIAPNCLDVFGACGAIATSELTATGAGNDLIECMQCAARSQAETLMRFVSGAVL